ncbi:polysaccharide pyruvyl transferase family protein [Salinimicrobium sp. MT39]|uniref:Polysaccharide pyruvyl transferase family protein n=1 Tax=Salinimicrobium profundisediminis TaxID=2994553 RepID=A0A9X3I0F2_9FLAO|nr:polysaccharide pyruvyl transferase family protein [Salinimicrobium profundisediminis]MCX2837484.1 polysaccharide pyruvyl transferase family protein [Salinimicrobium profundisediminis]
MAKKEEAIPLFYWSEIKFSFKQKENYGDLLSKYLVEKLSGRSVKWVHPKKQPWYRFNRKNFLAVGSILHHATKNSVVWGSGIIDRKQMIPPANFLAVRGPQTRKAVLKAGYGCPAIYGDPALLLPRFFQPEVEKKYELGIIPHYHDFKQVEQEYRDSPGVLVIDLMTMDVEEVTWQILQCEKTISSSLHGLIVSHAYKIPSVWVEFSNKLFGDGVKFQDYFESVGLIVYQPLFFQEKRDWQELEQIIEQYPALPGRDTIDGLCNTLIASCPFI